MRLQAKFYSLSLLLSVWPYLADASAIIRDTTVTNSTVASNSTTSSGIISPAQTASNTYDYIVVGSGPGGGPLAARLAQAGFSVLLLDAGEDHGTDQIIEIPLLQTAASEYTPITWQYFVNHYSNSATAMQDSKFTWKKPDGTFWVGPNPPAGSTPLGIYYPRASTLGGCAEHNALVALYPAEDDWNTIASLTGDNSWSAANMRQYWQKLENNQYITPGSAAAAGHGFSGWLDTTLTDLSLIARDTRWQSLVRGAVSVMNPALSNAVLNTAAAVSSMFITDINNVSPNRDTTQGLYQLPLAVTNSTRARSSPRTLMLTTAANRNFKLKVQLSTLVTRIMFDRSSKTPRATGVQYMTGSHLYRADPSSGTATQTGTGVAFARKEVIVSAGTFNTPQLLKLSGVGPKAELAALNIPVVLDAPGVGTNMQDRYEVTVTGSLPTNFPSYANCTFLSTPGDPCLSQWLTNKAAHGIYGTNGVAYGLIQQSSVSLPTQSDLFVGGLPANFHGYFPGYSSAADLHTWSYLVLKAHSRNNAGTVTLKSTDPRDMPAINFNSFTVGGDQDLQAVYEGVLSARAMFNKTMTPDGPFAEQFPGPAIQSEADVKAWIKREAWGHHASCSVPIGAANDPNAVLDSNFRVKGITGLRVVDASVFPKIPDFYIVGAIYMVSEKAAAAIISGN